MDAQILFFADSLGGALQVSLRRSRDICGKMRRRVGCLLDVPAAMVGYILFAANHSLGLIGRKVVGECTAALAREFELAAHDFLRACELVMDQALERTEGVIYFPEASQDSWNDWYENLDAALEALNGHHEALIRGTLTASMRQKLKTRIRKLALPVFKTATCNAFDVF